MQHRALADYLTRWVSSVRSDRKQLRILLGAVKRMTARSLCWALERWRESTSDILRLRELASKVLWRMQNLVLASAFNTWFVVSKEFCRHKKLIYKSLLRLKGLKLDIYFFVWSKNSRRFRSLRLSVLKVIGKGVFVSKKYLFIAWSDCCSWNKRSGHLSQCILQRSAKKLTLQTIFVWRRLSDISKQRRCAFCKVHSKSTHRCITMAFKSWVLDSAESKARKQELDKSQSKIHSC